MHAAFYCQALLPLLRKHRKNKSSFPAVPKRQGRVRVDPAFDTENPQRVYGAYVTFEPSSRTNWHIHPMGQVLIVTFGTGMTQEWGKEIQIIKQGDIVVCPPNVKHWHGAAPNAAMTHLAIGERLEGSSVTWLEEVSDEEYGAKN